MALTPGTRIGVYAVTAPIGAGGMGEVYRATDSNLKRSVAIKVLPASVAGDAERLARFQREAEVLAALNHPNIGAIYGLEKTPDFTALVMELVEGDDLSQRIAGGPLPLDEALPIAKQIAEALEAAHEQGIIHRDLKPANIKVRVDGTVKVLDFGLAKATEPAVGSSPSLSMSPTITSPAMTQAGMILGTAAYMSPEQAKGRAVDKRSDIWAFGCVLFEMLTGKRAFAGDDVSETLAAVLMREPDWASLPSAVPRHIATVVRRCLEKDRKARIPDVSAARFLLDETPDLLTLPTADVAISGRTALRWKTASIVAAAATLALAGVSFIHFRETPPATPELMRFEILAPDRITLQKFAISPDGRKIVFYAIGADGGGGVWVRSFDSVESRRMAETGASPSITWSPDSRFVAFPGGEALNKLMKVEVSGGPPQTICEIKGVITGGSWNHEGVIVFGSFGGGTYRVPAAGGEASPLTVLDASRQETGHSTPVLLPDGKHFLYLRASGLAENTGIYLGALDAKPEQQASKRLVATTFSPVYAPSTDPNVGYVLFLRDDALQAQPFDLAKLQMTGDHKPTVYVNSEFNETHGQFSPDGRWIAFVSDESGRPEIYVRPFPLAEGGGGKWTVSNGGGTTPRWRRDGKELFFLTTNLRTVMVAQVSYSPSLKISVPAPAFNAPVQNNVATGTGSSNSFNWDVTADGQKFLLATVATQENVRQPPINVVLNWTTLLRK